MKFSILFIFLFLLNTYSIAKINDTDKQIEKYIKEFNFSPLDAPKKVNQALFNLGKKVFFDKSVSGNRNISCSTCHHPDAFSGDSLPLAIGEGGKGQALSRTLEKGLIIPRNSPPLYNKGLDGMNIMFWDGRVSFDEDYQEFNTPEASFNGENPKSKHISSQFQGALDAQSIFPLVSHEEMRGKKGSNEIANAKTDLIAWQLIVKRITNQAQYKILIAQAFPNTIKINIGHIAQALGEFQRYEFLAINTAWDNYLRGDMQALTEKEKRGFLVFVEKGNCTRCHNGAHFSDFSFKGVSVPQVGPGKNIRRNDFGRFDQNPSEHLKYSFRVPPLRNIALTGPYFHDGAFVDLKEVVEHYNRPFKSLDKYTGIRLDKQYKKNYKKNLFVERDRYRNFSIKDHGHPSIMGYMNHFSEVEKNELLAFLKYALTDKSLLKKVKGLRK